MDDISVFDSDSPLGSLLDAVEAGRDVLILRDGRPVARLIPSNAGDAMHVRIDRLRALRDGIAARGETFTATEIMDFRDEGRRRQLSRTGSPALDSLGIT